MTVRKKMIIGWTVLGLAWVAVFAAMEGYALTHDDAITLSRFVWEISAAWPPLPFVCGFIAGFLCCHFWWGGIVSFKPVGGLDAVQGRAGASEEKKGVETPQP